MSTRIAEREKHEQLLRLFQTNHLREQILSKTNEAIVEQHTLLNYLPQKNT